ncbi:MAG: creatininase family protein [Armatimonadetes bacterium]|nr:creatininase family protein [Armatimonadota bacterium]
MKDYKPNNGFLVTSIPDLLFENNPVGRMKKEVWDASDAEIDAILGDYGIPSPPELGKRGTYIQTTPRHEVIENRRKNDIVFVPIGCTENHGAHNPSGMDTLFVTQILEGVRRYTAKRGNPCSLVWTPTTYGCHPYHHMGLPGTIMLEEDVMRHLLMDVMLGLWNDGFRKIIMINNHGHLWVLESAVQEFQKKYQLPGYFRVIDWHRAVREFFRTTDRGGGFDSDFCHADEAETSLGLLLYPDMVDMEYAVDTQQEAFLPPGHMDTSVDSYGRTSRWSEAEGHIGIELASTPEGVVGLATHATDQKAKRPVAAICRYLTLLHDHILETWPAGTVPPIEKVTLRKAKDMEPYLKEPQSEGWESVYSLPRIGF